MRHAYILALLALLGCPTSIVTDDDSAADAGPTGTAPTVIYVEIQHRMFLDECLVETNVRAEDPDGDLYGGTFYLDVGPVSLSAYVDWAQEDDTYTRWEFEFWADEVEPFVEYMAIAVVVDAAGNESEPVEDKWHSPDSQCF